ncbi:MAG: hypothetical protein LUO82_03755 [Methanomicrobiales archaeon]|nr:hypothetical protein [Methanomicrobiales archaeon]
MRKKGALSITVIAGITCLLSVILQVLELLPFWAMGMALVLGFPVFVVFGALWWSAGTKEGDIPFMGY